MKASAREAAESLDVNDPFAVLQMQMHQLHRTQMHQLLLLHQEVLPIPGPPSVAAGSPALPHTLLALFSPCSARAGLLIPPTRRVLRA